LRLYWYLDLGIAAGNRGVQCSNDPINVPLHGGPLRIPKNHNRKPTALEVLLVTDVFVGSEQNVKTSFFCRLEQRTLDNLPQPRSMASTTV
jgi:hypothetical protein